MMDTNGVNEIIFNCVNMLFYLLIVIFLIIYGYDYVIIVIHVPSFVVVG